MSNKAELQFENPSEMQWQTELDRIKSLLLQYLNPDAAQEAMSDIEATAKTLDGITQEILAKLREQGKPFKFDGRLLIIGEAIDLLFDGIHYLKDMTAESLKQAHDHGGGVEGVLRQIEKTKKDLDRAIEVRQEYFAEH